jgi:hypothetical protein
MVGVFTVFLLMFAPSPGDLTFLETSNIRLLQLVFKTLQDPFKVITIDQSAGERLTDIVLSFQSLLTESIISPGSNTSVWRDFVSQNIGTVIYLKFAAPGSRIMSGIGAAVFELGSIGLLFGLCVLMPLVRRDKMTQIASVALFIVLLAAIPLALPLVGVLVGIMASPPKSLKPEN